MWACLWFSSVDITSHLKRRKNEIMNLGQTCFAAHASSRFSARNVDRTRESGGNRAYVQLVETIKKENRKLNSKVLQDKPIHRWQCCSVKWLAVWRCWLQGSRHENIKPLVPSVWYKWQPETRLWCLLIGVWIVHKKLALWHEIKGKTDYNNFKIPLCPLK